MMGIGGTGVVTVNQIVGMAALIDGLHVAGLDQTGLSQKGGPVTSDLRMSSKPLDGTGKVSAAGVDLYLAFDLLGATSPGNLRTADPGRTVAVISTSEVPTGRMVLDTSERFPALSGQLDLVEGATRGAAQRLRRRTAALGAPVRRPHAGQLARCSARPSSAAPCRCPPRRSSRRSA